jgi:eukaryotic-like serine/threonine-protein kinase
MRQTHFLTDEAIRNALTVDPQVVAPAGLADAVRTTIDQTPQRRGIWPTLAPTRQTRILIRLAIPLGLLLILITALLIAGSPRSDAAAVGTFGGGPGRDGVMPGPAPVGVPVVAWGPLAVGPMGPWSPAVVDGVVFNADTRGVVVALDLASGEAVWKSEIGAPVNSGISVADGLALVGDVDGVIHAMDAGDGFQRWRYDAGQRLSGPPAVLDGIAYAGSVDGSLHAVRLADGRSPWPAPVQTAGPAGRAVAVADGLVYVGSAGQTPGAPASLAAYDTATGELIWSQPLQAGHPASPGVAGGLVFVTDGLDTGDRPSMAYAFDAATGTPAWPEPFVSPRGGYLYRAAVAAGRLHLLSSDFLAYALDVADGSVLWESTLEPGESPNGAWVDDLLVVTGSGQAVLALDPTDGDILWRVPLGASARAPAIINGSIVVGTDTGTLLSLSDETPG